MGYDAHITRKEFWADDEGPEIGRDEWLRYVVGCSDLTLDPDNNDYAIWSGDSEHEVPWLGWHEGEIYTKNPDRPLIQKMLEIARDLNAKVQGDDGEEYRCEDDLPPDRVAEFEPDKPTTPKYSGVLQMKSPIEPGLYRQNFRGLSYSECWRLGGVLGFPIALILKLFAKKGPYFWLPPHELESFCAENDLSSEALAVLSPEIAYLHQLGYRDGTYIKAIKQYDPSFQDGGAYAALHEDGMRSVSIFYVRNVQGQGSYRTESKVKSIGGQFFYDNGMSVDIVNNKLFLDDGGMSEKIIMKNASLPAIATRLEQELRSAPRQVRKFDNIERFRFYLHEMNNEIYSQNIKRKLFVKVSKEEEERVLRFKNLR